VRIGQNDHIDTNRELLVRARSDPEAIGELFSRHARALERFLFSETRDISVAAELTAETFAVVLRSAHRFRGTTDEEAVSFLYGISRNLARGWRRRGRIDHAARSRLHMPVRDPADFMSEVEERATADVLAQRLERAVRALPGDQRAAVELRVVAELSYGEVASRLGCSEPAARQRVARGLRTLKERLG
jgi:RNA polymerase sigma factor (sigma-70 family)